MAVSVYGKNISRSIKSDIKVIDTKFYGLSYPLGGTGGYFSKQSGNTLVRSNLTQLLKTELGERVMLPNFGCSLKRYLFEPLDQSLFNQVKNQIMTSITRYLPTVEVVKLSVVNTEDVNLDGLAGFLVTLVVRIKEDPSSLIETSIEIK
jgi:phage baseplate assembly protein W